MSSFVTSNSLIKEFDTDLNGVLRQNYPFLVILQKTYFFHLVVYPQTSFMQAISFVVNC